MLFKKFELISVQKINGNRNVGEAEEQEKSPEDDIVELQHVYDLRPGTLLKIAPFYMVQSPFSVWYKVPTVYDFPPDSVEILTFLRAAIYTGVSAFVKEVASALEVDKCLLYGQHTRSGRLVTDRVRVSRYKQECAMRCFICRATFHRHLL